MPVLDRLDRAHTIAPEGYNGWLIPPSALAIHLCIGQAYATSVYKTFQVGAIHSRLLTAWSAAGVAGPLIINGFLDAAGGAGGLDAAAYRPALLTMVGVLAVGLVANLLVRPVSSRHHEQGDVQVLPTASEAAHDTATGGAVAVSSTTRVVLSWAVVSLMLAYGVVMTLSTALNLLGG